LPSNQEVSYAKWPKDNHERAPAHWSIEERQACFIVKDGNGQALAYVYFEDEPGRRSAENLMSHDEAGALALNIAKLSELLRPSTP
jgi:hypothetical protein